VEAVGLTTAERRLDSEKVEAGIIPGRPFI
jgi:hypothetical protein